MESIGRIFASWSPGEDEFWDELHLYRFFHLVVPAGRCAGLHDALEGFDNDERIARAIATGIAEVHPDDDHAELLIDGLDIVRDVRVSHDSLCLDVFASGPGAGACGDPAVLDAVTVGCERSIDGLEGAADFQ